MTLLSLNQELLISNSPPTRIFLYDSVKKKRVGVITYQVSAIPFHEVQTPLSRLVRKQYL